MKYASILPLAASAVAFVIPDETILHALSPDEYQQSNHDLWDKVPSGEDFMSLVEQTMDTVSTRIEDRIDGVTTTTKLAEDAFNLWWDDVPDVNGGHQDEGRGRKFKQGHGDRSKTIWELVKESKYTTEFAKLVEKFDDIKAVLEDTSENRTVFVPTNEAFKHIPKHRKGNVSEDFVRSILQYHVVPGLYPAGRVLASHTLATSLQLQSLGDHSQRLRISAGIFGVRVNFYSKVVAINVEAKNGVIHGVNKILVPPPRQGKLIKLLPGKFSTLSLGLESTGLGEELRALPQYGGTFFAPTNHAFMKLGPKANAFLFSEHGKPFLKALLKYHAVVNETLYSDAYYEKTSATNTMGAERYHVDLPSLLDDKSIRVDIRRWGGFIAMRVNGRVRVAISDGVADDGVVQVVDSVLLPPKEKPSGHDEGDEHELEDVGVDELVERLGKYVEEVSSSENAVGDL